MEAKRPASCRSGLASIKNTLPVRGIAGNTNAMTLVVSPTLSTAYGFMVAFSCD
jgi:hypothetical protein